MENAATRLNFAQPPPTYYNIKNHKATYGMWIFSFHFDMTVYNYPQVSLNDLINIGSRRANISTKQQLHNVTQYFDTQFDLEGNL